MDFMNDFTEPSMTNSPSTRSLHFQRLSVKRHCLHDIKRWVRARSYSMWRRNLHPISITKSQSIDFLEGLRPNPHITINQKRSNYERQLHRPRMVIMKYSRNHFSFTFAKRIGSNHTSIPQVCVCKCWGFSASAAPFERLFVG